MDNEENNDVEKEPRDKIPPIKQTSKLRIFLGIISSIIIGVAIAIVVLFGISKLGYQAIRVSGNSMAPTYHDSELVIFKKSIPKRNDIIIFSPTKTWRVASFDNNKHDLYIKRIVAKGGDNLKIYNHKIIVNGKVFRNMKSLYGQSIPPMNMKIPKNDYFVMGDNYTKSNDSLYTYKRINKDYLINKSQVKLIAKGSALKNHDN